MRDLGRLAGVTLAVWAGTALPAYALGSQAAPRFAGVAALLCLAPAAATLAWVRWAAAGSPERQLLAVMGGMAVRMAFVFGVGLALYHSVPEFHRVSFWLWVIGFYLVTLTLEVVLVVGRPAAGGPPAP